MGFDIKDLHIDDDSPAGRRLHEIMTREGVTLEEAVRRGLGRPADEEPTPAERAWGAFSSPQDVVLIDEVMEFVRENRRIDAENFAERWK